MCMIDSADGHCEFTSETKPKARKDHKCNECYRTIRKGETYTRIVSKYQGDLTVDRQCEHCATACKWLQRECGGYLFGGVKEDLKEHWREDGIHTMELGRIIVGMQRKWQRYDGTGPMGLPVVAEKVEQKA